MSHSKKPSLDDTSTEMNDLHEDVVFENEVESGNDALKKLREKLKHAEAEKAEYLAGWQRAKADLINANKTARDEVTRASERAEEQVMSGLLPVLDSFSMAMANKEVWEKGDPQWRAGVEYIHSQLMKVMEEYGVEEIPAQPGDHIDYNLHHPVASIEADNDSQIDTISKVMQKGYRVKGSVVRPASVEAFVKSH